ncbi:MAG: excinuclease ABC subunit UvrC [Candidatus Anstonellales archaeon]
MLDISKITLPSLPGCYLFKDKKGTVLYVGKARNLKKRVKSYFSRKCDNKTATLLEESASVDFIITDNEVEALLLENSLIKRYFPKFNTELKSSEKFTYIVITKEKFPRLLLSRRIRSRFAPNGRWYGPFARGSARILVADTLRKAFGVRICKRLPKKACLQYYLGNCTAPCEEKISEEDYLKRISILESVLTGEGESFNKILETMRSEMKKESDKKNFERAMTLRDSIRLLEGLSQKQKIERKKAGSEDYISYISVNGKVTLQIFKVIEGVIRDRERFFFEAREGEELEEFLSNYYERDNTPDAIYLENKFEGIDAMEKYLTKKAGRQVRLLVPKKGEKLDILNLLKKNVEAEVTGKTNPALLTLQKALKLREIPRVIDCFDISTLFGKDSVGSVVRFVNGKPEKSSYRRFKIRFAGEGGTKQDDPNMIGEIIFRRYKRLMEENAQMPNLVLIDGGTSQLKRAMEALSRLRTDIDCISLAKGEEAIYSPNFPQTIKLGKNNEGLKILIYARDEAHRFGLSYHRALRRKAVKPHIY